MDVHRKQLMDTAFKYSLNEVVAYRSDVESARLLADINDPLSRHASISPKIAVVIGRFLEECHGGFQMHYVLNRADGVEQRLVENAVASKEELLEQLSRLRHEVGVFDHLASSIKETKEAVDDARRKRETEEG